jgi:GNAT superfamily N-acetyltransferase
MTSFHVRPAVPEDSAEAARVVAAAFAGLGESFPEAPAIDASRFELLLQTGSDVLVAEHDGRLAGVVRRWQEDGVAWLDLLASARAGAGRALLRAVEHGAQDRGCRTVRLEAADVRGLPDFFQRAGYSPVSRTKTLAGHSMLTMEKRVPLLTVREQRRGDGPFIERLTGRDGWLFDQQPQAGWFIAADGEHSAGVVWVQDHGAGVATVATPLLVPGYEGRGLEVWMIERAALWAETNGFHTLELAVDGTTKPLERTLEDYGWFVAAERAAYVRRARQVGQPELESR